MEEEKERHLLLSNKPEGNILGKKVLAKITTEYSETREGKILFFMVANLLARLRKITKTLILDFNCKFDENDDIPGLQGSLLSTLEKVNSEIEVVKTNNSKIKSVDATIVIGNTDQDFDDSQFVIFVECQGWWASLSNINEKSLLQPQQFNPVGAILGATLAVGQVFKNFTGFDEVQYNGHHYFSGYKIKSWNDDQISKEIIDDLNPNFPRSLVLTDTQVVGAGAVAHSFVNTLAYISDLSVSDFIIIDRKENNDSQPEFIEKSNLNRYILVNEDDIGKLKAKTLSEKLIPIIGKIKSTDVGLEDYINSDGLLSNVISCVDNNLARHKIQKRLPNYILGGSTYELGLKVELYDLLNGTNCIMCYNNVEDLETDEEIHERLQNMSYENRHKLAEERNIEITELETYLKDPKCGTVEIQLFAENESTEFSVGFVSVLSGLFLAVQYIQQEVEDYEPYLIPKRNILEFPLLTHNYSLTNMFPNPRCECVVIDLYRDETIYGE